MTNDTTPITKADLDAAMENLKEVVAISTENVVDKLTLEVGLIASLLQDRPVMTETDDTEPMAWDQPARTLGRIDNNVRALRMDAYKYTDRWERHLNRKLDAFLAALRIDRNGRKLTRK
jgi:hypothetical protein